MRYVNDTYVGLEDGVFIRCMNENKGATMAKIARIIKKERPEGINPIRYTSKTSIHQHLCFLNRSKKQ